MPFTWFRQLLARRTPQKTISDAAWNHACAGMPFLAMLSPAEHLRLRELAAALIARKSFSGAAGLELTDDIVITIAAQACLPVLHLGLELFDDFSEIIVYPGEFHVEREIVDDAGVVHDASGALAGEAMPGGPVVISWEDVRAQPDAAEQAPPYNVVIHEFAHKLDLANGEADGLPILHPQRHAHIEPRRWRRVLAVAYDEFCAMVDALEADFPEHIDPESDAGLLIYDSLPLDAYAADDPAEFFAVASEAYFTAPARLRAAFPAWYRQLDAYYRPQDRSAASPTPLQCSSSRNRRTTSI